MPFRMLIVRGVVFAAGTKSSAPWTVQKSPLPSAATIRLVASFGPVALVLKVQTFELAMPANVAPAASLNVPFVVESMVMKYVWLVVNTPACGKMLAVFPERITGNVLYPAPAMTRACTPGPTFNARSRVSTGVAGLVELKMRIRPLPPIVGGTLKVMRSGVSMQIPLALFVGDK